MAEIPLKLVKLLTQLTNKIERPGFHQAGIGNCLIFEGKIRPTDGYCYLTYTYFGRTTSCTVGKAQWLVQNKKCPLQDIPDKYQVSHLCHNKNCIKKEHLTLEPGWVNLRRKMCITGRQCIGHGQFPQCQLDYRFVYNYTYTHISCMKHIIKKNLPDDSCDHQADACSSRMLPWDGAFFSLGA